MTDTIVFFGSGPVAAKSLELLSKDFEIEAVVTKPKPPHHRGEFPVIELASKLGLRLHTTSNRTELSGLISEKPFTSELGVLIDFGIIVAQDVIDYFPLGIVNSHFSLLPEWRGADPITFSILSGQPTTGVSLMLLVEKMDEGPLIAQSELNIAPDMTTPKLTEQLIDLSHQMLKEVLPVYISGDIRPYEQPDTPPISYSRKLSKNDGLIDWGKPAQQIEREIRAFVEWPKSRTTLGGKEVIITKAYVIPSTTPQADLGKVTLVKETKSIAVDTASGSLWIERLKPAGKQEMSAEAFLAGYKL